MPLFILTAAAVALLIFMAYVLTGGIEPLWEIIARSVLGGLFVALVGWVSHSFDFFLRRRK